MRGSPDYTPRVKSPPVTVERIDLEHPSHRAALRALIDGYARDPMGGGQALSPEVLEAMPGRLAQCPTYLGLLAFVDATPAGLLNAFWSVSTFKARRLLNVHDIAVDPAHRGIGVGRRLLNAAEDLARELQCCKITLEVLEGNRTAMRLYSACGFEAYRLDPAMGEARFMQKWLRDP